MCVVVIVLYDSCILCDCTAGKFISNMHVGHSATQLLKSSHQFLWPKTKYVMVIQLNFSLFSLFTQEEKHTKKCSTQLKIYYNNDDHKTVKVRFYLGLRWSSDFTTISS